MKTVGRSSSQTRPADGEPRAIQGATLIAATLGFAMIQLDVFVVNVGVKQIGGSLGGGTSALQWIVGIYTLLFAALILTCGALADRFGARRMYSLGFLVFLLGSIACGLAPNMDLLIGARAVQGAGAALLGSCSLALLNRAFNDDRKRARAVGIWAAGAAVALSAGPIVGGMLIAEIGWRSIFFINVPLGLVGLYMTRRHVAETPRGARRIDIAGQIVAVLAMAGLAGALIEEGKVGIGNPYVDGVLALSIIAGVAFCRIEMMSREPMLPLSLFRKGTFAGPAFLGMVINIAFYGLIFDLSLYFQQQEGLTALQTGLAFMPLTAAVLVTNLSSSRLAAHIGVRPVILIGLITMGIGCAGLLLVARSMTYAETIVQQALIGGGIGLVVPSMTNALLGSVSPSRSGVASGTLNTTRQTGSVLGVAVFGSLIATPGHFIDGFQIVLIISIALVAAALLLAWPIAPARATKRHGGEQC